MTCQRPRGLAFLALIVAIVMAMPAWAVVPPKDPTREIPPNALAKIRDNRDTAFQPANPLAGVVPGNVSARKTAGALTLSTLSGTFDYAVLPAKYLDSGADPWPPTELENELFQQGYSGLGRPGSLRDYFDEVSYNNYQVNGTVHDWVTVSQNGSFYFGGSECHGLCASTTESAAGFVDEVIGLNDATVDFSLYDNDGPDGLANSGDDDGVVDLLVIVQPNAGGECGISELWSHLGRYSDTFTSSYATGDAAFGGGNILIEDYIVVPALDCDGSSLVTIGPFAHLFGLHLGLPPLWDRDGTSRGVGAWDVMARGLWGGNGLSADRPVHPSAYSKALLGWTIPQVVSGLESGASFPAVESTSHAREFRRSAACSHEESFLLENRQNTGFDLLLPSNGLMIWHADDRENHGDNEARPRLALVQSDARYGLENGRNDGDNGDPWPGILGRASWRDVTDPSSARWDARPSGAAANAISLSADPMTADLSQFTDPEPHITSVTVDDALPGQGDADGAIDPFETVRLSVALSNEGQVDATAVSGTLTLNPTVAGVTITDGSASWPDIDPCGASSTADFDVSLDASVACETELNFELALSYSEGSKTLSFTQRVGKFFTSDALRLTTAAVDTGPARVASTGSVAGVTYHVPSAGRDVIRMARVDTSGTLLSTTDISAATTGDARHPDVAWNGSEYGATWDDDRDGTLEIYFARVDSDGNRVGSELRVTTSSGASSHPRLAWNDVDSEWGIVWADERNGNSDVYFARVSSGGAKVGSDVAISSTAGSEEYADIAWNGTRFGVAWQDDALGEWTIYFTSTNTAGTPQITPRRLEEEAGDSVFPAIAYNGTGLLFGIAYIDYYDNKTRTIIRSSRSDPDGLQPIQVKTINDGMGRAESVDLDSDGSSYFVSWVDHRDGHRTIRLSRTDDRFNPQLDALLVDADASYGQVTGVDYGNGQVFAAWIKEDASTHRFDAYARGMNTSFECGRDDDGDGVDQPGDNCPQMVNPDQLDADNDDWGDVCDCDDVDPNVNPGETETICDNIDNDCSSGSPDAPDADSDGVDLCDVSDINNPDGVGVDCDDTDPINYPGNTEVCDGQDNDCDATIDEDFPVLTWYRDADLDAYGDPVVTLDTCDGNQQGYVADNTDCDDTRADVNPGEVEACDDGADTDCDGSIDETTGDRYIATTGSDAGNECEDSGAPCLSLNHAIHVACDNEKVWVNEGSYTEDIIVDHPVKVDNIGLASQTYIDGTGTGDVVQILSSNVNWDGVNARGAASHACFRLGDSSHSGLRGITLANTSATACAVGVIVDSTGVTGDWNRILAMDIASNVTDGSPDTGLGVLFAGGNGRIELKSGWIRSNASSAVRVATPPEGAENKTLVIVGNRIYENGADAAADSHTAIEIHDASDVRIEGNRIYNNTASGNLGRAVTIDALNGGNFYCNRIEGNNEGLLLTGGATGIGVLHNNFQDQTGTAFEIAVTSGSATLFNENKVHGNGAGVDHAGDGTLDARHNWWGTDDGPGGSGPGSGDSISGSLDSSNFIARNIAPILARRPTDFGWSEGVSACREKIQNAINNAAYGDLIIVGEGQYREHITMDKVLDIEGISGGGGCSPTEIDGRQSGGSHLAAMTISDVDQIMLTNLTIRSSGEGTACGSASGDEIGLDLHNVDNSNFTNLCLKENGVTELRVYGDSDGNHFQDLVIDGMIRLDDGTDVCGHRSREGLLIDGGPACEGGPGAIADNNSFDNLEVNYNARSVVIRLANGTEIKNSSITASPAAAWDGGTFAAGVMIEMANNTTLADNTIGAGEENEGIRVAGRDAASCVTEGTDSTNTTISGNEVRDTLDSGIRLYKQGGDPGSPINTQLSCNNIHSNDTGVLTNYVGASPANEVHDSDIQDNVTGLHNTGIHTLTATENYWGAADGPSGSGPGSGDAISGAVTYSPWRSNSVRTDDDADSYAECEGDCDDANDAINPDATELCDDIDNNCDGSIDEGLPTNTYYRDADGDTYGDPGVTIEDCADTAPTGYVADNTDCDDTLDTVHPNATEVACDNIDQACDGSGNEAPDGDTDGYDQCDPADPYDGDGLAADCDDSLGSVHPGGTEIACDGLDQDCLDGDLTPDVDNDGADICGSSDANNPDGIEADCDDGDPARAPHLDEICDSIDNDCDDTADEGLPLNTYYRDQDEDNYGDAGNSTEVCDLTPPGGYVTDSSDCDDTNDQVHPNATENCSDNVDNDCDSSMDAADATCSVLETAMLRFQAGSKIVLEWDAATGADSHALYRGSIPDTGLVSLDHFCAGTEINGTSAQDSDTPLVGEGFYYLSTGLSVNSGSGEIAAGPLGSNSAGASRPDSSEIACGPRVYVDPDAAGSGNGLSWADAYTTVSSALSHSKASDRGLEVWIKGTVTDSSGSWLKGATRAGARFLGGFAGTETDLWQRNPTVNPTVLRGGGAGHVLRVSDTSAVIDGLTLENAATGLIASTTARLEARGVTFQQLSSQGVDVDADRSAGSRLFVSQSSFDNSSAQGIRAIVSEGTLSGAITQNSFTGSSDAAVRLEARPGLFDAHCELGVIANTIQGGNFGIVLGAHLVDKALSATETSLVSSNLVYDTSSDAIRVEASGDYSSEAAAAQARSAPLIILNTLSDGGDAGLVCSATRTDTTADPSLHRVEAVPEIWDNLITFLVGNGIEESADDVVANLVADPLVVGNDLHGNGALYLDEGATTLPAIADVNALSGNSDNQDSDPLFTNRPTDDYTLASGSPAIDQAHTNAPASAKIDVSGGPRTKDGDSDGTATADLGAHER